jgi:eukaryotic-like serine/threonine-protein kinase
MDNIASLSDQHRTISRVQRVMKVRELFEAAWRAGQQPKIEQYLANSVASESSLLLPELVMVELALRRQSGEKPTPQEYRERFPDHTDLIEATFHSEPPPQARELEAGVTVGDFHIQKRIGAGGMGIVYLARQWP